MNFVFVIYALFILLIFNSMTQRFCLKLEMNQNKQTTVFRFINIMILILLVSSYVKVLNEIGRASCRERVEIWVCVGSVAVGVWCGEWYAAVDVRGVRR